MNYLVLLLISLVVVLESLAEIGIQGKLQDAWCRSSCLNQTGVEWKKCCKNAKLPDKNTTINQPYLHCKDENTLTFKWTYHHDTNYFLEAINKDKRIFSNLTILGAATLKNLKSSTNYRVRLWAVSPLRNFIGISEFLREKTGNKNKDPLPVQELVVEKLSLNNDKYEASLRWKPSDDLSCNYDIVWYEVGDFGDLKQLEVTELSNFEANITGLEIDRNYSIGIAAKSGDWSKESSKIWIHTETPSCLETFKTLQKCLPLKPENVTISEVIQDSSFYNVKVSWTLPEYVPDYYSIHFMNLVPLINNTQSFNVSGNATGATLEHIELGAYYQLRLTAWSLAGPSHPVVNNRHVKGVKQVEADSWNIGIVLIVVASLSVTLLILVLLYFLKYCRVERRNLQEFNMYFKNIEKFTETTSISENMDEWEMDEEQVELKSVLGEGAFGIVRKASLTNSNNNEKTRQVAVKMLKENATSEEIRQFHQEIDIMKSVGCHPHLVSIIGCITRGRVTQPLLIVEYCSKGNLQNYLRAAWDKLIDHLGKNLGFNHGYGNYFSNQLYEMHSEADYSIQPKDLMSFARQIAIGMEYLSNMRVVHRDLAARNILVCDNSTVKISDFGLSRDVYQDNVYCKVSGGKLPMRWMALECLTHQRYTTQSDVWSFGILLWEIVTLGGSPYPDISTSNLLALLKEGYRMDCPTNCSTEIYNIMRSCWRTVPKDRPTFTDLRQIFDKLLEGISNYLVLDAIAKEYDFKITDKLEEQSSCERYVKPISVCNCSVPV